MKDRTIKKTVTIRRASLPLFTVVAMIAVAFTIIAPMPAHAALLNDIVTSPVKTLQNVVSPSTNSPSSSSPMNQGTTTQPAQPSSQAPQTSESTTSETSPSQSASASQAPSSSAQSSVAPSVSSRQPVKEAGDQSVTDMSPISYVSRQISRNVAASLYLFAAALALFGLIVYAATLKPKKSNRADVLTKKPTALRRLIAIATRGQLKPGKG